MSPRGQYPRPRHPSVPTLREYAHLFKATREMRKWTQVEMAKELCCSQARVSRIEVADISPTAAMLWVVLELNTGLDLKRECRI